MAEQAVIAERSIAAPLRSEIKLAGGYFCTPGESAALARVIFGDRLEYVAQNVGQSAARLAELAGFDVPPKTRVLLSDQTQVGRTAPLSAEKLNPVLAFYEVPDAHSGYQRSLDILRFGGIGHTASLWAHDPEVVAEFSALPSGRILVNTPCLYGGMGYSTDLEPSFMLGTGTWSGSIISDNVTALHLINIKRVAYESRPWRSLYDAYGPIRTEGRK